MENNRRWSADIPGRFPRIIDHSELLFVHSRICWDHWRKTWKKKYFSVTKYFRSRNLGVKMRHISHIMYCASKVKESENSTCHFGQKTKSWKLHCLSIFDLSVIHTMSKQYFCPKNPFFRNLNFHAKYEIKNFRIFNQFLAILKLWIFYGQNLVFGTVCISTK